MCCVARPPLPVPHSILFPLHSRLHHRSGDVNLAAPVGFFLASLIMSPWRGEISLGNERKTIFVASPGGAIRVDGNAGTQAPQAASCGYMEFLLRVVHLGNERFIKETLDLERQPVHMARRFRFTTHFFKKTIKPPGRGQRIVEGFILEMVP